MLKALDTDQSDTAEHYLGPMDVVCRHCQAVFFPGELQACCKNGQLSDVLFPKLLAYENIPDSIKELYDGHHEHSDQFFQNIRLLNSALSPASLGISSHLTRNEAIKVDCSLGGYSFVVHGQLYRQISPLLPRPGTEPTLSQLLFYDSEYELRRRAEICKSGKVSKKLLEWLQKELHAVNKLFNKYKAIGTQIIENPNGHAAMVIVEDFKKLQIKQVHPKLYDKPSANDLAALVPENSTFNRDIIVQKHGDHLERISESHPAADPLSMALIYVNGDLGWSPKMQYEAIVSVTKKQSQAVRLPNETDDDLPEDHDDETEPDNSDQDPSDEDVQREQIGDPKSLPDGNTSNWSPQENEFVPELFDGFEPVSLTTKLTTLTLYLFVNFFLHVRKDCFNLLFKGNFF